MTRIARISFSCHLMKPDEPDSWRNDYLVNPVCLVIKFKKGQTLSQRLPFKSKKTMRIANISCNCTNDKSVYFFSSFSI